MVETVWSRLSAEWDSPPLTVTKLARVLGVSFQGAVKVKNGGGLSRDNNLKLATRLGLSPYWLASGKGPKKPPAHGEGSEPSLEASLWCLAIAAEQIEDEGKRSNIADLIRLVVANPAENAVDQIPIIVRRLSGESGTDTGSERHPKVA